MTPGRLGPYGNFMSGELSIGRRGFVHIVTVGHSLDGQNDLAAVEAWLARTPKTCIGVRVSELSIELAWRTRRSVPSQSPASPT